MPIKIITTEDGSHSLYDEELNETYHSTRGAWGESMHVFIKEGLEHWLFRNGSKEVSILEVGLGTGLNAFLTALHAEKWQQNIHFTSLEPFPLQKEIYENLNYHKSEGERTLFMKIHEAEWEKEVRITDSFALHKTIQNLEDFNAVKRLDLIFFDAFAPSKQPDVWSFDHLKKCFDLLEKGGVLTTYCAQGQFKRNLADVGFEVETLQGAMGKKEMVRGVKRV